MPCNVHFLPADVSISVPEGTTVSDAARLAGITTLHLPCSGRGTCGKCMVDLEKPASPVRTVAACSTGIDSDCTVSLRHRAEHPAASIVADASIDHIDPQDPLFSPLCRLHTVTIPPASAGVNSSDLQRISEALGMNDGTATISCTRRVLRQIAGTIRREDGMVNTVVTDAPPLRELCTVTPGSLPPPVYGIAADIGTTTVELCLVNLSTGAVAASAADYNAQLARGSDLISRIDYARSPERLEELNELIVNTVNDLISSMLVSANIMEENVHAIVFAGNCTMTHLFLGLQPDYIRESPFMPVVNAVPQLRAADCSLLINPDAVVVFAPGAGSHIGGDITAGLLCTDMVNSEERAWLFIDIGTNNEIIIGNKRSLLTCTCCAGPAFEGNGIGCGVRADRGAVDSFSIDPDNGAIDYTVIGETLPRGICGSGLISLLGELLRAGIVDRSGTFTGKCSDNRLITIEGIKKFILIDADAAEHDKPIIISEPDITTLLQTKASIHTACELLLRNAGLDFSLIDKVFVAGGFGKYIDIEAAIRIGLFPDINRNRFSFLGNTSLAGATRMLLSRESRTIIRDLPGRLTFIDLHSDPGYRDACTAARFLPYTET